MKMVSKFFIALLVSFTLIGGAFAAGYEPSYGLSHSKMDSKPQSKYSEVKFSNKTSEYYTVTTIYLSSGKPYVNPLDPIGTSRSVLIIPFSGIDDQYAAHVLVRWNATGQIIWDRYVS